MLRKIGLPSLIRHGLRAISMPLDVAPEHGLVVERERLDQPGIAQRELLHLELVVRQVPVLGAAARQRAARGRRSHSAGRPRRWPPYGRRGRRSATLNVKPLAAQLLGVRLAMQDDLDAVGVAVLGHLQTERLEVVAAGERSGRDVDDADLLRRGLGGGAGGEESDRDTAPSEPTRGSGRPGRSASGRRARSPRPARACDSRPSRRRSAWSWRRTRRGPSRRRPRGGRGRDRWRAPSCARPRCRRHRADTSHGTTGRLRRTR